LRRSFDGRAGLVWIACLAACAGTPQPRYALPEEPTAAIVELRKGDTEIVRMETDGTIRLRNGTTSASADQIQELLRFIIEDQRFFEIDQQALKLAVHQANSRYGSAIAVMDGNTTRVAVRLRDRGHAVEQYALEFSAQRYSAVPALQRLAAVERAIVRFVAIAHLGGESTALRMLRAANDELYAQYPEVELLTMDDLATAGTRKDGALVAHFRRSASATTVTVATVVLPQTGDLIAKVRSNEQP